MIQFRIREIQWCIYSVKEFLRTRSVKVRLLEPNLCKNRNKYTERKKTVRAMWELNA